MFGGIDSECAEGVEIEVLNVHRGRLHHDLELVVMLETVGVFAIPAVGRPAGRFNISDFPGLRAEDAKKRGGIESACPLLYVVRLLDHAPLACPVALERKNQILKSQSLPSGFTVLLKGIFIVK
jgi:hypothetical protein